MFLFQASKIEESLVMVPQVLMPITKVFLVFSFVKLAVYSSTLF